MDNMAKMNISCAYCERMLDDFNTYKFHLKIFHNKKSYGDKLLCSQGGCPRDFTRFQTLKTHIERVHLSIACIGDPLVLKTNGYAWEGNSDGDEISTNSFETLESAVSPLSILRESIDEHGVLSDGALLVARLRSNPKIPLSAINDIIQCCQDLISPAMCALKDEIRVLMQENQVSTDSGDNLVEVISVLENPFSGLETTWKQNKYFEKKGVFIAPHTFLIDSYLVPAKSEQQPSHVKNITGEYIPQKLVIEQFLCLPGVLKSIVTYMESGDGHLISDFRDGQLWQQHPVRLRHLNTKNTLVIPVFDFFDDLETANPLGSHCVIHKVGAKYTVVKALKPMMNSKLENIFLNMLINSNDRQRKGVFDIYLDEMKKLESDGFTVTVDGVAYKIFVVLVQVIGDNLGLNGLLGYVESFTANFPCRLCKVSRAEFNHTYVEIPEKLRTEQGYLDDLAVGDPSMSGIKGPCPYNNLPSFNVVMNVYCDLMHDVLEGVCRYVIPAVLNCFIYQKKLFNLDTLNGRITIFTYDHSSQPPYITADHIKKSALNLGAIEMLNLVLALNVMIGDLVVTDDEAWEVYLILRNIVLYCCGLNFCEEELVYFQFVIGEFLEMYRSVFGGSLTLKFHNLTHYPRVIRLLGPMYNNWVMRCEAKHSELKKAAVSSGNFKNIRRTLAVRHQMKQAERFFACRGFTEEGTVEFGNVKVQNVTLSEMMYGSKISELLGNYGLYRELFKMDSVTINSVCFETGDILVYMQNETDIHPSFQRVNSIFVSDCNDCFLICTKILTVGHNHHYQAYEVLLLDELTVVSVDNLLGLLSPWPLKLRAVNSVLYVALRHKI